MSSHAEHRWSLRSPRRRKRLMIAGVTLCITLVAVGLASATAGFDWLRQQAALSEKASVGDPPQIAEQRIMVASDSEWAVLAWNSDSRGLCLDVAFRGRSATGCGFPVTGATPEALAPEKQQLAAWIGTVNGRGPQVVVAGVAAPGVARVDLALADGRTVSTTMHGAPTALGLADPLRFFVSRFDHGGELPPAGRTGLIAGYVAYDASGDRLGVSSR